MIKDAERIKSFYEMEATIRSDTAFEGPTNFCRYHKCHLASTYYPSGFENALLVSYDGMGEIEILDDTVWYPHLGFYLQKTKI